LQLIAIDHLVMNTVFLLFIVNSNQRNGGCQKILLDNRVDYTCMSRVLTILSQPID